MDNKTEIESILKQRFFVTPTGYPSQNGFLDYGPPLTEIKHQIIKEYKKIFVDENVYEMEPSAVLPYEVLKSSGHIDKFCDVILTDGENIVRADHYIEDKIGEVMEIPIDLAENYGIIIDRIEVIKREIFAIKNSKKSINELNKISLTPALCTEQLSAEEVALILKELQCTSKHLSDMNKQEIDFTVTLHNLHSPAGKIFNPAKDFNLIFKLNEKQFLRPELAQSQFTSFRKLFDLNNEKLPFASLSIGRSYRNEISARGGMLRTKEFEQAEIEYFTEDGKHSGFEAIRNTEVLILPNTTMKPFKVTISEAFEKKIISSEAICFYIAKSQEFLLTVGFNLESLRYRQHNPNEMAHYANDCWDVEIKTLCGWVECAGIADRATFDLNCHSNNVNVKVSRRIEPRIVYTVVINKAELGRTLKSDFAELESIILNLDQNYIKNNLKDNSITIEFKGTAYNFTVTEKMVDLEFFIPRVIEPSFGISRVLYALVEQSFKIRDGRTVLSLKPKMCYLHCMITYLKYLDEYASQLAMLKKEFKSKSIRFRTNDRTCSIGRKYSSCDEIGVPFFITFDFDTPSDNSVTIRERDSTSQIRVKIDMVASIIDDLINERVEWSILMETYSN